MKTVVTCRLLGLAAIWEVVHARELVGAWIALLGFTLDICSATEGSVH